MKMEKGKMGSVAVEGGGGEDRNGKESNRRLVGRSRRDRVERERGRERREILYLKNQT